MEAVEREEGWVESSGIRWLEGPWGWMSKMHRMEVGEQSRSLEGEELVLEISRGHRGRDIEVTKNNRE